MLVRTVFTLAALLAVTVTQLPRAQAQVFEVIHPEVQFGGWEVEALNGIVLDDVEDGEEKSVHEFAVGFGFTEFWKSTIAVEVVNPEGADALVEAFEWENVVLLPFGGNGHQDEDGHGGFELGVYTALEIPQDQGPEEGALAVGPIFETEVGPVTFIGNVFVEVPFENGLDPGLAYAAQASAAVSEHVAIGLEAHGDIEEAFGDAVPSEEQAHFIGPAVFFEAELGDHVIEPRVALLFGLTEATPDAVLSVNFELKFGSAQAHR